MTDRPSEGSVEGISGGGRQTAADPESPADTESEADPLWDVRILEELDPTDVSDDGADKRCSEGEAA